jgi:hypothetical protein
MVQSPRFAIVLCLLLTSLCCTEALKGGKVKGTQQRKEQSTFDRGNAFQERDLQNKSNNNNKKTPTSPPTVIELPTESPAPSPSPTAAPSKSLNPSNLGAPVPPTSPPSEEPTTASPTTSAPSESPTTPSAFPSTPFPSFSPTAQPSMAGFVGFLNVTFSLFAQGVTTKSIIQGKQAELVANITDAILNCLCQETDFVFLEDKDNLDSCHHRQTQLRLLDNAGAKLKFEGDSILRPDQVEFILSDRSKEEFLYTEWIVEYPVIQIGNNYLDASANPLYAIQALAQKAVDYQLYTGLLWNPILLGSRMAIVGQEVETWRNPVIPYYKALNPAPFHTLRVAGIILFVLSAAVTYFITRLAKQRRIEREWEAEFKERGKGGLQTEEGVLHMLETGRNNAAETAGGSQKKLGKLLGSIKSHISDDDDDALAAAILDAGTYEGAMEMEQSYDHRSSD